MHKPIGAFASFEDYASDVTNPEYENPEISVYVGVKDDKHN